MINKNVGVVESYNLEENKKINNVGVACYATQDPSGITLISLIITIIVMLILAGVTLSITLGENGLLQNSKNATKEYKKSEGKEKIEMALTSLLMKKKEINLTDIVEIENQEISVKRNDDRQICIETDENDEEYATVYCNNNKYYVYGDSRVIYVGEGIEEVILPKEIIDAKAYVTNGLKLYYDAQNNTGNGKDTDTTTWKDLSGNNNDGTLNGANWGNDSLKFDGVDDWVAIGELDYSNITMEVIFDTDVIVNTESNLICNYEAGGYGISLIENNVINGQTYINGDYQKTKGDVINTNQKYKITYTTNGSESKLYINRNLVKTSNTANGRIEIPNTKTILVLGANPTKTTTSSNTEYFSGNIYQVKIYDKVLTEQEIEQNYNIDKVKYNIEQSEDKIEENIIFSEPIYAKDGLSIEVKAKVKGYTLQTSTDGINWEPTKNDKKTTRVVNNLSNNSIVYARLLNDSEYGGQTQYNLDYYISNLSQLEQFRNAVNGGQIFDGKYINLINDIDLTSITTWTPIGNASNTFKGIFNGNGHKIINLNIDNKADYQGLFGYNEGIIENLNIESGTIKGTNKLGAIVGNNAGSIMNCSNKAKVDATEYHIGGICGFSSGIVQKCYNEGECKAGGTSLGGIVGRNDGLIKFCNNNGSVVGENQAVGGVAGSSTGIISSCKNITDVETTGYGNSNMSNIGGVVGNVANDTNSIINVKDCYNTRKYNRSRYSCWRNYWK